MARPKNPPPNRRDPWKAWGNVPADDWDEVERLAKLVGGKKALTGLEDFGIKLREACHNAHWELYERNRSDDQATRLRLASLCKAIRNLQGEIVGLGSDAQALLEQVAEDFIEPSSDKFWFWLEPKDFPPDGSSRLALLKHALNDAHLWAESAVNRASPVDRRTVRRETENRLAFELAVIWLDHSGKQPTVSNDTGDGESEFSVFCFEVMHPIWAAFGEELTRSQINVYASNARTELNQKK